MTDVVVGDLDTGPAVGWIGLGDDDPMATGVIRPKRKWGCERDPMIISVGVVPVDEDLR